MTSVDGYIKGVCHRREGEYPRRGVRDGKENLSGTVSEVFCNWYKRILDTFRGVPIHFH